MASSETNFEDRLRLYWPELKQRYMELYHDDTMLKQLRRQLAAFSEERRDSLKQRDAEKQDSPNWYQSRELLGMMLYIDNFAGNLKGVREKLSTLWRPQVPGTPLWAQCCIRFWKWAGNATPSRSWKGCSALPMRQPQSSQPGQARCASCPLRRKSRPFFPQVPKPRQGCEDNADTEICARTNGGQQQSHRCDQAEFGKNTKWIVPNLHPVPKFSEGPEKTGFHRFS